MSNHQIVFINIIALVALLLVLAPLVWAAIQDGRYDAAHHRP